ncbi:5-formyltetrahydrofolate cyclo-ligase [Parvicella tangerina]|uniref:5-formyltetrahydrofolate cyclo-ligase n=1 Tax=Parvicella tangerina TaxID=2829795 RepID=A0A916JMG8_9FLAO|nr:5-formyltetrahydrofolate cyclo-ligase [Parvicella tangerina]CAG5081936.1 5-formyltetrahydrofolate cyclo-ligase [Parvicella tangerina]
MTKQELRQYYLDRRRVCSENQIAEASAKINQLLINHLNDTTKHVHVFIPLPNSKEINIWSFIEYCWQQDIQTATSLTFFKPKRLEHSWFDSTTTFKPGVYGTVVPSPIKPVDLSVLDIVVVPLLCVDDSGNRIGYGQGFYDGFLAQLPTETKKIGVSLFEPIHETIKKDPWDIPLDAVISPVGLTDFTD